MRGKRHMLLVTMPEEIHHLHPEHRLCCKSPSDSHGSRKNLMHGRNKPAAKLALPNHPSLSPTCMASLTASAAVNSPGAM